MPEFPEVHTITNDLKKYITGFKINKIILNPKYTLPNLKNKTIKNVKQVAKNIVLELDSEQFLVLHLAMTGRILLRKDRNINDKWVKITLEISKNNKTYYLKFSDMREFGKVQLLDKKQFKELTQKYGPTPLDDSLTSKEFLRIIRSKNTNIKNILLDQRLISGIGNIYATDALFLAKIDPKTKTKNINLEMTEKLLKNLRLILEEAIKNRGSTLPDGMYVDIFGKPGLYQKWFKIYMKHKCPECGGKVEYFKLNGRGTYWCPHCQPTHKASAGKSIQLL